jgi:hypothetical protein
VLAKALGAAPLGFPLVGWRMVDPVFAVLSLFLFEALLLFFALFAAVAHRIPSCIEFKRG